jgi:hypothetical protein
MSSRVVIKTLKFCVSCEENLTQSLDILNLPYTKSNGIMLVNGKGIEVQNDVFFMRVLANDRVGAQLFYRINSKAAEIESQLRALRVERNAVLQAEARESEEAYRVRQIQKEQDQLEYERKQLELERQNFVDAKKQAIVAKAKAMGYSVQERIDGNSVKLKLVKRIY